MPWPLLHHPSLEAVTNPQTPVCSGGRAFSLTNHHPQCLSLFSIILENLPLHGQRDMDTFSASFVLFLKHHLVSQELCRLDLVVVHHLCLSFCARRTKKNKTTKKNTPCYNVTSPSGSQCLISQSAAAFTMLPEAVLYTETAIQNYLFCGETLLRTSGLELI